MTTIFVHTSKEMLPNQHKVIEVKNIGTLLTVFLKNITVHTVTPSTKT